MKIFGFSRKGFLYIDNGNNLASQQTTSDESNMLNKYASLPEFKNFDEAQPPTLVGPEPRFWILEGGRSNCKS